MGRGFYHEIARLLVKHKCKFVRQGRGSHEIWYSPHSGKNFPVSVTIVSKLTANGILKQAGIADRI